jgi:hypothetical protein
MENLLKESVMIDARFINGIRARSSKNPMGVMWRMSINVLIGVTDLRPRIGNFATPWSAHSNPLYKMPEFRYITDSLKDLLDRRALEIMSTAKKENKRIMILWSGGIDSTTVLSSFIKNCSTQDLELITVVMNTASMIENFEFYRKFISGKISCFHYSKFDVTDELLDSYILLHGDPADCLYGPSIPAYRPLMEEGKHLENYRHHLDRMAEIIQPSPDSYHYVEGMGKWWVDKVTANLEEVSPANIETVADWWWWTYYNFKWEFSCQRPFYFSRRDFKNSISDENLKFFADNVYYGTDQFQNWSYSNLKNLIGRDRSTHKIEAKNYIFELDKNQSYYDNKTKMAGAPGNQDLRLTSYLPLCYDKNWVGYYYWEHDLDNESASLLEDFKG